MSDQKPAQPNALATSFKEDDVAKAREFGKFMVDKMVVKEMSVSESIQFNKLLVWYNQLATKVEAHVLELVAVHKPADQKEQKPNQKKGKK